MRRHWSRIPFSFSLIAALAVCAVLSTASFTTVAYAQPPEEEEPVAADESAEDGAGDEEAIGDDDEIGGDDEWGDEPEDEPRLRAPERYFIDISLDFMLLKVFFVRQVARKMNRP